MSYKLDDLLHQGVPSLSSEINTLEQWSAKRKKIQSVWLHYIGGLSKPIETSYTINRSEETRTYKRQHITYKTAFGDKVTANLLIPKRIEDEKFPAMLALHSTDSKGKDDVSHPKGRKNRNYGIELCERGYVVLAPDAITAGERVYKGAEPFQTKEFYEQHSNWSAVGKMLTDHIQGLDLLQCLDFVDEDKLGAIGHSLGGYNAFFLGGLDERVKVVVSSCGLSVLSGDPEVHRWGHRSWFSHIPMLSEVIKKGYVPFEFHEIAALVFPKPFFNWSCMNDHIFPHWEPIMKGLKEMNDLYQKFDEDQKFMPLVGNAGHDFPEGIRELAYSFIDRWLKA
ncbi:dienelactone hydrolase family protein [Pseudalkalibacillus salsuginis]|uniref:dienelactone hydrolase family protein n=1 Tax=Pseudalkalibacillus salsuginis TaxID=2910972 RepID=UPI001F23B8EB|nr:acetylxylan esterase [Pseudalkalibacillus salsuginis]MCF6409978.1 acetylxylan esterase [Pseudalkalibacillus salsuginis]